MLKTVITFISILLSMSIWFYLLYYLLSSVNASDLAWFLYWCYVPVSIIVESLIQLAKEDKDRKVGHE